MAQVSSDPVRLGLVGAGLFMNQTVIPNGLKPHILSGRVRVTAIYSRSRESAEKVAAAFAEQQPKIYTGDNGLSELFDSTEIDAVYIALPAKPQAEAVEAALRKGRHVMSEKPMAVSYDQGLRLYDIYSQVKSPNQVWMVSENYRFESGFLVAGDFISRGIAEHSMGFQLESSCHFVAGLRAVLGCEVDEVVGVAGHYSDEMLPTPDTMSGTAKFSNGVLCSFLFTYIDLPSRKFELTVIGTEGTLTLTRGARDGKHGYTVSWIRKDDWEGHPKVGDVFCPFNGLPEEFGAFFESVRRGRADPRGHPAKALLDVAMIHACLQPTRGNKVAPVDEV